MIELKDLDGLKLVRDENVANLRQTLAEIEHAITQGSQGWGVTEEHAVLLHVAGELRAALMDEKRALPVQAVLDDALRALKGKQLELGRANARHDRMVDVSKAQSEEIANLNAIVGVKDDKIRELENERADFLREELAQVERDLT